MAVVAVTAMAGVAAAGAGLAYWNRPRDPEFEVVGIELKGFKLRFSGSTAPLLVAVLDARLVLSIKVTNPNVTPIHYDSTTMYIFYRHDRLGEATIEAGNQGPTCDQIITVPANISGLKITKNLKSLFFDIRKREMCLISVVTIKGHAQVWKWAHEFEVHVQSDIKIDPIHLDVIDQDNNVHMQLESLL